MISSLPHLWRYRARCSWLKEQWQNNARNWYSIGEKERADLCQSLADYWSYPFWKQLLHFNKAMNATRKLSLLEEGSSSPNPTGE